MENVIILLQKQGIPPKEREEIKMTNFEKKEMRLIGYAIEEIVEEIVEAFGLESRVSQAVVLFKEEFEEAREDEDIEKAKVIEKTMIEIERNLLNK